MATNDERRSLIEKWNAAKERKVVCVGPSSWLQTHVTSHSCTAHALAYDSIADCQKAVLAWMKGPRKADLVWCHTQIDSNEKQYMETLQEFMSVLLAHAPPSTTVLIASQQGLETARQSFARRRACQDPRSSVVWTAVQEEAWQTLLESTRRGWAFWVGTRNLLSEGNHP